MSARKIGGGRILGTGKGLAPPPVHSPRPIPHSTDSNNVSIASSSTSPASVPDPAHHLPPQDLMANISLNDPSRPDSATGGGGGGGGGGASLVCPICNEEMVTLLQLNRHIDDTHQELPQIEQDEVKTWFDKQVLKAKRFQPLSVINQTLRGLDVFESNESTPSSSSPAPSRAAALTESSAIDPDDLITQSHWQRQTLADFCTDPACGQRLNPINGSVNCRKCGRLFCEQHTMYQIKLSRSAAHEPVRGYWQRVCETCYKSRDGYNDHNGYLRDHSKAFADLRGKRVQRLNLDISRLEKRLSKLTQLLADASISDTAGGSTSTANGSAASLLAPVSNLAGSQRNTRKQIEQSVVAWQDDSSVTKCPFCQQEFGSWTFRRHHCRICGRVVCADLSTKCSTEVMLNVKPTAAATTTNPPHTSLGVRMCRDCNHTIFSKRDFLLSLSEKPADQRAYETLRQFERGIGQLMPSFQKALMALQQSSSSDTTTNTVNDDARMQAKLQEASKLRKRLMDSFAKYGAISKRLRDLKTDSPTQKLLQNAIYSAASSFLHTHMLSLKSVPQILRSHSSNRPTTTTTTMSKSSLSEMAPSPLRHGATHVLSDDAMSQASETNTATTAALEAEETELRERLLVLEEQRFMIGQMVSQATGARRFEEVSALSRNAEELDAEIATLKSQVGGVEARWEGMFTSN